MVLFQGVRAPVVPTDPAASTAQKLLRLWPHSVRAPVDLPYSSGPWDTGMQEWQAAAQAAQSLRDDDIIMLLLRPFLHDVADSLEVRPSMKTRHSSA